LSRSARQTKERTVRQRLSRENGGDNNNRTSLFIYDDEFLGIYFFGFPFLTFANAVELPLLGWHSLFLNDVAICGSEISGHKSHD
jgi:hypothetical protein